MTNRDSRGGPPLEDVFEGNYVDFKIVDEQTGDPVNGIQVLISDARGKRLSKTTIAAGFIRFSYVPRGQCDLLGLSDRTQPIMETKQEYALQDGDTLLLLAEREEEAGNPIKWDDIAAYNWGAGIRKKEQANVYMRDIHGCAHYDSMGHMVYKKDTGTDEKIKIPVKLQRTGLAINTQHEIKIRQVDNPEQFKACCGIPYITFQSAKSFIAPNAQNNFKELKKVLDENEDAKAMVFGHTDLNVRDDEQNKKISDRRAKSVFAFLTRDTDYWVTLYKKGDQDDNEDWGPRAVQVILNYLNPQAELDLTNTYDTRTREEINKNYSGIGKDGDIPEGTLKEIFKKYMDKMTGDINLEPRDFIEPKYMGCAGFNPVCDLEISAEENRRVTFFLFNKDNPPNLPCAHGDINPCKKQTRQYDADEKDDKTTYRNHRDFRCCYYDSLARDCTAEIDPPDRIHFDGHMHIMSGHCTPLPLLRDQIPLFKLKRKTIDGLPQNYHFIRTKVPGGVVLPEEIGVIRAADMGGRKTIKIADQGVKDSRKIYKNIYDDPDSDKNNKKDKDKKEKARKRWLPMVAMPMDMAYAHIDGYRGKPIYRKVPYREYYHQGFRGIPYDKQGSKESFNTPSHYYEKPGQPPRKIYLWPDEVGEEVPGLKTTRSRFKQRQNIRESYIVKEYNNYNENTRNQGFYYFLDRKTPEEYNETKSDKVPRWLPAEEMDMFQDWDKQKTDTISAALKYPLVYIPMYHYEPRRWSIQDTAKHQPDEPDPDKGQAYDPPGHWHEPFADVATPKKPGVFIGFKMYTALGYKPFDPRLKKTLTSFYDKCEKENIPVLCHCSDGGVCSHDIKLYFDMDKSSRESPAKKDYKELLNYRKKDWFYDEFVSPHAWKIVLNKHRNLKLCLAHFGGGSSEWKDWRSRTSKYVSEYYIDNMEDKGFDRFFAEWYESEDKNGKQRWIKQIVDLMETREGREYKYPNLYVDISYHFIKEQKWQLLWLMRKHPVVRERILFGSDWYMTELDKTSIRDYVAKSKSAIDLLSKELTQYTGIGEDLWLTFTRLNPMKFFGIRGIAEKLKEGLEEQAGAEEEPARWGSEDDKKQKLNRTLLEKNLKIIKNSDFY
ncbi:MAG: OmpA family protein [Desulfobacterales bacterium]